MITKKTNKKLQSLFLSSSPDEEDALAPYLTTHLETIDEKTKNNFISLLQLERPSILQKINILPTTIPEGNKYDVFHQNFLANNTINITKSIDEQYVNQKNIKQLFLDKKSYTSLLSVFSFKNNEQDPSEEFKNTQNLIGLLNQSHKNNFISKNEQEQIAKNLTQAIYTEQYNMINGKICDEFTKISFIKEYTPLYIAHKTVNTYYNIPINSPYNQHHLQNKETITTILSYYEKLEDYFSNQNFYISRTSDIFKEFEKLKPNISSFIEKINKKREDIQQPSIDKEKQNNIQDKIYTKFYYNVINTLLTEAIFYPQDFHKILGECLKNINNKEDAIYLKNETFLEPNNTSKILQQKQFVTQYCISDIITDPSRLQEILTLSGVGSKSINELVNYASFIQDTQPNANNPKTLKKFIHYLTTDFPTLTNNNKNMLLASYLNNIPAEQLQLFIHKEKTIQESVLTFIEQNRSSITIPNIEETFNFILLNKTIEPKKDKLRILKL